MERLFWNTLQTCLHKEAHFLPYPAAADRAAYEALSSELKKLVIENGEAFLGFTYPYIRATDFMKFARIGNRVDFEAIYFAKRRALNALVLAECVEYQGRFVDDIINGIFSICEESAWQLSCHNAYKRGEGSFILPDVTRPVLDLFACETGALLACIYYLLKDKLAGVSPFINSRILHEVDKRIWQPYLNEHFWWMGEGDEPMCNWTIWCTQNVLLSFFLIDSDNAYRSSVLEKAVKSCDYFLKDYGEDGCCDEGAQYYRHAGLCLFNTMEVLNAVTDGGFVKVYQNQKIKNIAAYILNVHAADKYYFNFADCSPVAGRAGVREYLFGKRTGQQTLSDFGAEDFVAGGSRLSQEEINLYYRLQEVFTYEEITKVAKQRRKSERLLPEDVYYASTGLLITKGQRLSLAVKAGANDDNHNHNDTGSFILYKNGRPVFVDIGVESYTAKTFSDKRYEIWTMQSGYHNLPTINGLDEHDGGQFRATDVEVHLSGAGSTNRIFLKLADSNSGIPVEWLNSAAGISMELSQAYPLEDKKIYYHRSVAYLKEQEIVCLRDETNAGEVILNLITYEEPVAEGCDIKLGELAAVRFSGAELFCIERLPITDARLQTAWDKDLYRIRLKLVDSVFEMQIV